MEPFQEKPPGVELRSPEDHEALRKSVFDGVKDQFAKNFPYTYGGVRMELTGEPEYADQEDYDFKTQKEALLTDKFLTRRLRGGIRLVNSDTGEVLDERDNVTFMKVPYITDRGTVIHGGNEYSLINQARLIPGAYTRRQSNGDLETQFNVRSGSGRRMQVTVNPEDMQYRLRVGGSNLHFYSLMKDLGIDEDRLRKSWGDDILTQNKGKYDRRVLPKAYAKMVPQRQQVKGATQEQMAQAVKEALDEAQVNRDVLEMNLPNLFDRTKAASWIQEGEIIMRKQAKIEKRAAAMDYAPVEVPSLQLYHGALDPEVEEWVNWKLQHDNEEPVPEEKVSFWKQAAARLQLDFEEAPTPRIAYNLQALGIDCFESMKDPGHLKTAFENFQFKKTHEALQNQVRLLGEEIPYLEEYPDAPGSLKLAMEYVFPKSEIPERPTEQVEKLLDHLEGLKEASADALVLAQVAVSASETFQKEAFDALMIPNDLIGRAVLTKSARYGAGVLFKNPDGTYLLEKNYPDPGMPPEAVGKLRPAGGGKSKRDRNLRQTIIREIGEEFGLEEDYVKERIRLLGYIPAGKFKDCAMFEMVDHGLKPGTYQATNSPNEKVVLVKSTLDDPDYIGCHPKRLRRYAIKGYRGKRTPKFKHWVGVDLDGTLAEHDESTPFDPLHIGKPIPNMLARVKRMLARGEKVKIFTARAYDPVSVKAIHAWTKRYIGQELEVTNEKDPGMIKLLDDRAVRIEKNKGTEKKASYREGGKVTHNGEMYDLDEILSLTDGQPIEDIPVSELSWVLEHDDPDPERVAKADLSAPIVVEGNTVLDGLHRLSKAVAQGVDRLPGYRVSLNKEASIMDNPEWEAWNRHVNELLAPYYEKRSNHFIVKGACGHDIRRCRCRGPHDIVELDLPCFGCFQELEKKSSARAPRAVIIKGNPKYISGNKTAETFYDELKKLMESRGYTTSFDAGEDYTTPDEDADVWVGHSRGASRLEFAPEGVRTLDIDPLQDWNPESLQPGEQPPKEHYEITDRLREALDDILSTSKSAGSDFENELNQSKDIPDDVQFYTDGKNRCTIYFGDWHEQEIWDAAEAMARKHFKDYEEPDDSEIGRPEWASVIISKGREKKAAVFPKTKVVAAEPLTSAESADLIPPVADTPATTIEPVAEVPKGGPDYDMLTDYIWDVENAQKVGLDPNTGMYSTYDDRGHPAVGPGIRGIEAGRQYSVNEVNDMVRQAIDEHWERSRTRYPEFDQLDPAAQVALFDHTYMGVEAPNLYEAARQGQDVRQHIELKNDRRQRKQRELYDRIRMLKQSSVAPVVKKERTQVETYLVCPHCGEEIHEKGIYLPRDEKGEFIYQDGELVSEHRTCGGQFIEPKTPEEREEIDRQLKQWGLS